MAPPALLSAGLMIKVPAHYNALFFDFDGVLVDTVEVKTRAFAHLFEPFGSEIRAKVIEHHRSHGGMTRVDKFRHYYEYFLKMPLDGRTLANLCNAFSELVVEEVVAAPEIPGAEEFLMICHREMPCFVISATPSDEISVIVARRGWTKYFVEVCGSPTSKREHLGILLNRFTLQPGKCLFFGDAIADYDASQSCGIHFMGIIPESGDSPLRTIKDIEFIGDFYALDGRDL